MKLPSLCKRSRGLCALLFALSFQSYAQPVPVKHWTTAQGLSHNRVSNIRRDSHGFLWFCTLEGLSRFDGHTFVTFDQRHGLPHLNVTDILETRDGSYWVSTNGGGVARYRNDGQSPAAFHAPQIYLPGPLAAQQRVNTLFQNQQGVIYAGTDEGIFRLMGERFERLDHAGSPNNAVVVTDFAEDALGALWIGSWSGLFRLSPAGRMTHIAVHPMQESDRVDAVLVDHAGKLWIGARPFGVLLFDPAQVRVPDAPACTLADLQSGLLRHFTERDGLPDLYIWSLFESSDGLLWIGSEQHLTAWDGARLRVFGSESNPPKKLSQVSLDALVEDTSGNLWAGTNLGAIQLIRNGLTLWTTAEGLGAGLPHALFEGRDFGTYVITNGGAVSRFNGERFESGPLPVPANLLYFESYVTTLQDRQGEWWVPTHAGLWRFPATDSPAQLARSQPRARYGERDGLPPAAISRLFEDRQGDIWCTFGGSISLARWERATGRFRQFNAADGVPRYDPPLAFCEDRQGTLWMALTGTGLLRYRDGRFSQLTPADGLPAGSLRALRLDQQGRLWLGSDASGAACLTNLEQERPTVRRFTQADGLSSNNVLSLAEDRRGRIYFGTGRGLDWLDPATERIYNWQAPTELNIAPISLLLSDREGYLWVGGLGGLLRVAPDVTRPPLPPVVLTELVAGDTVWPLPLHGLEHIAAGALAPNNNRLRLSFSSPWFVFGERPLYQYKLADADADWSTPSAQNSVNYARLAAGGYQFLVRPVAADGTPGANTVSVQFKVLPPVWQRGWFLGLTLLGCVGLGYGAYRYRLTQLLQLERVRTRIATDLHDDLGANLTRISILSEVAKQRNGVADDGQMLSAIADIARESVSSMSDIVWAINPERDNLRDLTRRMRQLAEEVFTTREIQLQFNAPEFAPEFKLDAHVRRDLYLVFKEAVNNAARHSGCTRAEIDVRVNGAHLCLTVRDNGHGFDPARASDGNGLLSMHNRAKALGSQLEIETSAATGTRVQLRVPLAQALLS